MAPLDALPEGWAVWSEEPGGRVILAFRPDVFDAEGFAAACLPTITVAPGATPDRPAGRRERSGAWHVALYLEPTVRVRDRDGTFDARDAAVEAAVEVAGAFAAGRVDYRDAYQVPREDYLDALDGLVGREG